jgi:ATP-dependent Lon protease
MTGEVTLQGRVLAIGGIKEKLLAAKQHEIKKVLLPQENYDETQEVLKEINLDGVQLVYVSTMDEVLKEAFGDQLLQKTEKKARKSTQKKQRASKKSSKSSL